MTDTPAPTEGEQAVAFMKKWSKSYDLQGKLLEVFRDRDRYGGIVQYPVEVLGDPPLGPEAQKYVGMFYGETE